MRPLRRAEAALRDERYEAAVTKPGIDLTKSRDAWLFPPSQFQDQHSTARQRE
jgi:hypothetical protein